MRDDLRKVETSERFPGRLCFVEIFPYFAQKWQAGEDTDLFFRFGVESILLRSNQIEESFGPAVQVVQTYMSVQSTCAGWCMPSALTPVLVLYSGLASLSFTRRIKHGEKESPIMQSVIFQLLHQRH